MTPALLVVGAAPLAALVGVPSLMVAVLAAATMELHLTGNKTKNSKIELVIHIIN